MERSRQRSGWIERESARGCDKNRRRLARVDEPGVLPSMASPRRVSLLVGFLLVTPRHRASISGSECGAACDRHLAAHGSSDRLREPPDFGAGLRGRLALGLITRGGSHFWPVSRAATRHLFLSLPPRAAWRGARLSSRRNSAGVTPVRAARCPSAQYARKQSHDQLVGRGSCGAIIVGGGFFQRPRLTCPSMRANGCERRASAA